MKKIYISLPITGHDLEERKAYAEKAAEQARKQVLVMYPAVKEVETVTPFDVCPQTDLTYADYIGRDITALCKCDMIGFCEGWIFSKGCRIERVVSSEMGIEAIQIKI